MARHRLRAYDAVQLASALAASSALDDQLTFVVFDRSLSEAATREGLSVLPIS